MAVGWSCGCGNMTRNRGQAYTLEGVIGAIIIASALVLGIQAVNVEPWTDDGPDQGTDLRTQTGDTLEIAQDRDALKTAVTCLGGSDTETPHPGVISTDPNVTSFGTVLNQTLSETASYVVYVDYPHPNGEIAQVAIGSDREPTTSSVTVTRQVTLFDSDPVLELDESDEECQRTGETLDDVSDSDIYLSNQGNGDLYAVVQIRVVAW